MPVAPRAVIAWASEPAPPGIIPIAVAGDEGNSSNSDFRPEFRLLRPAEFSAVFGSRQVLRSEHFELRFLANGGVSARLGLVIAKRFAKRAVLRNLIKRLARESFRQVRSDLPCSDMVFRLTRPPLSGSLAGITGEADRRRAWRREIDGLLARLPR